MANRAPLVTCYTDTDLVHSAYATGGLIELANDHVIELQFRLSPRLCPRPRGPFTMWMEVQFPEAPDPIAVCCDFHDRSTYTCPNSLATCDWYFKSNYSQMTLEAVDKEDRFKIRPFGLYSPCRPQLDRAVARRQFGNLVVHVRHRLNSPRRMTLNERLREFYFQFLRYRRYLSRFRWPEYESPPANTIEHDGPLVFFNPTCWKELDEETRDINRLRARAIVLMRELLGNRFAGGFRRSELAETCYPEALEDRHYSHHDYLEFLHKAPIALYTNGLGGCFSWRLIEVFASSKCIVSERIANDPGYPIDEQAGIIQCDTAEEIAAVVNRLQRDPERILEVQRRARQTYETHMRPAECMRHLLDQVAAAQKEHEAIVEAGRSELTPADTAGETSGSGFPRIPVLSGAWDNLAASVRDWATFAGRQPQWLLCMALFVLFWTAELFAVQEITLVYPNETGPRFAFWAPKIRLALDLLFISILALSLRPRYLRLLLVGSFLVYFGLITYHRYFAQPLTFLTIRSAWREGLQLGGFVMNLVPIRAGLLLALALVAKLVALGLSGQASPPRVRLTGALLATSFVSLFAIANYLDPLSAIQTTRGVGRLGEIRGYLGPWYAEWYYLRHSDVMEAALMRRQIPYDRLTPIEASIPVEKHLVIMQAESLDANILGYRAEGQEVTPFLNRLRDVAMFYRVRAIHLNGSADADFVALTGVSGSTHVNTYTLDDYPYENTTPQLLARCGFKTYSFHGNSGDFYNRRQPYEKMGFSDIYFREELENEFDLKADRWGITDKDVLAISSQKLRTATGPTCHFVITLTTHIPYRQLTADEMEIYQHPRSTVQNYVNNMRYLDNCLRDYITSLGSGTTIVIYGDHPTELGEDDFAPDRTGAREYVPVFIYDTSRDLAKLQKTRDDPMSTNGELNLVDIITYLRHQVEALKETVDGQWRD